MPDPDTQRAINETLHNVRTRIQDHYSKVKRKRDGNAQDSPILSERMHAYSHAMQIVNRFIEPVKEINQPDA